MTQIKATKPMIFIIAVKVNGSYQDRNGLFYTVQAKMIGLTEDTNKPIFKHISDHYVMSEYTDYFDNPAICILQ